MKKIFYFLMVLALGTALTSCSNDNETAIATGNPGTLTIGVNGNIGDVLGEDGEVTRVSKADGNYTTWDQGDIISVGVAYNGEVTASDDWQSFSMVNIGDDGNTADFRGPYTIGDDLSELWVWVAGENTSMDANDDIVYMETDIPHIFYGVAPASNFTMRFEPTKRAALKEIQKPTADAFDGSAVLMTSLGEEIYRLDRNNVDPSQNTSVKLQFQHRTGFLQIKPGVLPEGAEDDIVKSVKIAANDIVGTTSLPFDSSTGFSALEKSSGALDVLTLDYEGQNLTLGDLDIWAVVLPGTYESVDITIVTSGYDAINYVDRAGLVVKENTIKPITLDYDEAKGDNSAVATPTESIRIDINSFEGVLPGGNTDGSGTITYNQQEQGEIEIDWQNIKVGGAFAPFINTFAATNASVNAIANVQPLGKRIKRIVVEGFNSEISGVASVQFGLGYVGGNSEDNDIRFEPKTTGTSQIFEYIPEGDFPFFNWSITNRTAMVTSITIDYEPGEPAYPGFEPGTGGGDEPDPDEGEEIIIDQPGLLAIGLTTGATPSGSGTVNGLDVEWRNIVFQFNTTYLLARNASDNYIINTAPVGKRIIKVVVNCRSDVSSGNFDSRGDATVQFGTSSDSFVAAKSTTADGSKYVEEFIAPDGDYTYFKFASTNNQGHYESIKVIYEPAAIETERLTFSADAMGLVQGVRYNYVGSSTVDGIVLNWNQLQVQFNNGGWEIPLLMITDKDNGYIRNATPIGAKIVKITIECNTTRTGNFDGRGKGIIKFGTEEGTYGDAIVPVSDNAAGTDVFTAPAGDFQYFEFTTSNASANYQYVHIDYVL